MAAWRGGEPSRQYLQGKAGIVPPLVISQIVEIAHLVVHVLRHGGIELRFKVKELALDRIRFALGEKRRAVELAQLLLGQPSHEVNHVCLASAFTRPALETVSIEKPYEQFKVGIIAVVRRRGVPRWWDGEHGFWGVDLSTRHPPPH